MFTSMRGARRFALITIVIIVAVILTPVAFIGRIVLGILQGIVILAARTFRHDLKKILSPVQAAMALEHIHVKPKVNIIVHYVVDGPVTCGQFRSRFQNTVLDCKRDNGELVYPELRQFKTTFLQYFFWKEDDHFDIKNHIRNYDYNNGVLALSSPCGESDIERVTGELLTVPWTKGRSPWEILVVPDYREEGTEGLRKTLLIFRLHHSLADGYSILKMSLRFPDPGNGPVPEPIYPKLTPLQKVLSALMLPFVIYYRIAAIVVDGSDAKNSWHRTDLKLSRKFNTCLVKRIPVSLIKEVRKMYGVSYSAVLASATCGGIRKVMLESGQKIPDCFALFTPLPIPNHPDGAVIHATGMMSRWPVGVEYPFERIKSGKFSSSKSALLQYILGGRLVIWLFAPCPSFAGRLVQSQIVRCTGIFSSFPAPETTRKLFGFTISDVMFCFGLPAGKVGASITLLSYAGNQRIVINVDKTVLGSHTKLLRISDYIHEELEHLLAAGDEVV